MRTNRANPSLFGVSERAQVWCGAVLNRANLGVYVLNETLRLDPNAEPTASGRAVIPIVVCCCCPVRHEFRLVRLVVSEVAGGVQEGGTRTHGLIMAGPLPEAHHAPCPSSATRENAPRREAFAFYCNKIRSQGTPCSEVDGGRTAL
jgi:hypothetical protein